LCKEKHNKRSKGVGKQARKRKDIDDLKDSLKIMSIVWLISDWSKRSFYYFRVQFTGTTRNRPNRVFAVLTTLTVLATLRLLAVLRAFLPNSKLNARERSDAEALAVAVALEAARDAGLLVDIAAVALAQLIVGLPCRILVAVAGRGRTVAGTATHADIAIRGRHTSIQGCAWVVIRAWLADLTAYFL